MDQYLGQAATLASEATLQLTRQVLKEVGGGTLTGHAGLDVQGDQVAEIKILLDSKLLTRGHNILEYFPLVIRNIASPAYQIRRLVYIILLRYAHQQPDLALMSVNTLQKDLNDQNALVRAMSLRVLSSIRVQVIGPLVLIAIRKAVVDMSPIVRRAAAVALSQIYELDSKMKENLLELIEALLADKSPIVLGAAVSTLEAVFPDHFHLIHSHFHKLCSILLDSDEWTQVQILNLMLRYGRAQFLDSTSMDASNLDPDLAFMIQKCIPLLASNNAAVVTSVVALFHHLAPASYGIQYARAMIRIMCFAEEEALHAILVQILTLVQNRSTDFAPYARHFYLFDGENSGIQNLKIQILQAFESEYRATLKEFKLYLKSSHVDLVLQIIGAMDTMANKKTEMAEEILKHLCRLLRHPQDQVVGEAIVSIRSILERCPTLIPKILPILVPLSRRACSRAKESIYWLYGQHSKTSEKLSLWASDVLRLAALEFQMETVSVKLQILNMGAKLVSNHEAMSPVFRTLFGYIISQSRFDTNVDVRDRARFFKKVLDNEQLYTRLKSVVIPLNVTFNHTMMKLDMGTYVLKSHCTKDSTVFTLGSLSHLMGKQIKGYIPLPNFPSVKPDTDRGPGDDHNSWQKDTIMVSTKTVNVQPSSHQRRIVKLDEFYDEDSDSMSSSYEESEEGGNSDTVSSESTSD